MKINNTVKICVIMDQPRCIQYQYWAVTGSRYAFSLKNV